MSIFHEAQFDRKESSLGFTVLLCSAASFGPYFIYFLLSLTSMRVFFIIAGEGVRQN